MHIVLDTFTTSSGVDDDGDTSERNEPVEGVVLAANRLRVTATASNANDGQRGACNPDEDVEVLEDDAEQAEQGSGGRG